MNSRLVNRHLSGLLVATVLFALAACADGDSASLGKPVELRFRKVMEDPYPAETSDGKPPETTVAELDSAAVFDKVGDAAAETAEKLSATPTDAAILEKLEPFADLSPEEANVLPPKLRFFVPSIGCAQLSGGSKADDEKLVLCDKDGQKYLLDRAEIDNSHVESVEAEPDERNGGHLVAITFSEAGAKEWEQLTGDSVGRQVAIVVDGVILAAPEVQQAVAGGATQIVGDFSEEEAEKLAAGIEAGTK